MSTSAARAAFKRGAGAGAGALSALKKTTKASSRAAKKSLNQVLKPLNQVLKKPLKPHLEMRENL
jgi:hypothetical protein